MVDQAAERPWWQYALVTVPTIVLLGSASGWLSNSGYSNQWFDNLVKPDFMPPGWTFGAAWTALYTMMGLALALILAEPVSDRRRNGLILFFIQLALNFSWSPIFFAAHDISLAKYVIFGMAAIAAGAAGEFFRLRKLAGILLMPYLAWLVFAAMLNSSIERLNPGGGTSLL